MTGEYRQIRKERSASVLITAVRMEDAAAALGSGRRLASALFLAAAAMSAGAAEAGSTSASMAVTVEVVRPAQIDYQMDSRGTATVRTLYAEAKVTTTLRAREKEADGSLASPQDQPETLLVTVEY